MARDPQLQALFSKCSKGDQGLPHRLWGGGGGGQEILQAAAFPGRHFHGRPGSSRGHAVFRPSPWYSSVFLGAEVCTELLLHAESSAILRSTRKLLGVVEMFLILTVVVAASQMYRVQQK